MRLLITADLHYNHPKSRALADDLIDQMNHAGGDVLLVVGDSAVADGDSLEQCLNRFSFSGPKLFVAGNHELWSKQGDSYDLFHHALPRRVQAAGWHWLEGDPFRSGDVAFVGTVGWYDYAFAPANLGIPRRFYEAKLSPGAAARMDEHAHLLTPDDNIAPEAREMFARWNDAKFVRLGRSDEAFLEELLTHLRAQLESLREVRQVIAAVHHIPFAELLPPPHSPQWDFVKAFLGSPRIGEALQTFDNVRHLFCGHSHFAAEVQVGAVHALNIGSGYRAKTFKTLDL